ncbi:hypothetical protein I4U23_020731 [Adineta vaga]|nr:hypothetical protein I4U23_020731 [Adineta vaga]
MKNYILIVKTHHGNPGNNITVVIKGIEGQTEQIPIEKSQSHHKNFKENHTDLFLLLSNDHIGKIIQVEFHTNTNAKFKEWKYSHIFIIDGIYIYRDLVSTHSLSSSVDSPLVIDVIEPQTESQESIYYAFIKTGHESCSKGCYPKLSLFGNNEKYTEYNMMLANRILSSSANNPLALEKHQFDIFQWQDHNIGRIMLNRMVKSDRYLAISLEQKTFSITGEYGDSCTSPKQYNEYISSLNILNKQSNATTDEIGRYYVIIRNLEGTNGNVYIDFHGDRLASASEQQLSKCENYPEHPFDSKHTDLFHLKALEVGHIHSVTLRLDQTDKEHTLTLDTLFVIHNAKVYEFNLKYIILNKEQSRKEFIPITHSTLSDNKVCYYIATHTADKMLSGTDASFQVVISGSNGTLGPLELKESLTNGKNPFEKECIDIFHIEEMDIGDPKSIAITLEPKGLMGNLFSTAKCERIMVIKNGDYNSQWQLVGELKAKETKTISFPARQRQSIKDSIPTPNTITQSSQIKTTTESISVTPIIELHSPETKVTIEKSHRSAPTDNHRYDSVMVQIEDHQKRYTFAPSLHQAEQNYRELRRLLKKMNEPISKITKT